MSLKKISQLTGASVATVSRVLNNPRYQCQDREMTEQIRQTARGLGYVPDQNARHLKMGNEGGAAHPFVIDVLPARFHTLEEDPFFAEIFRCVETECHHQGCAVGKIWNIPDIQSAVMNGERVRAQGLLILGKCSPELVVQLLRGYRGVIAIDRNPLEYQMDEIVCNGARAAEKAVEYLLELGHTKIAYVGDCNTEMRYTGYYECLLSHKLPLTYDYVVPTSQTRDEGYHAFGKVAALPDPPTAIFCANDITALGFLQAMKDRNGRRRKGVYRPAVIAIDDIEEASQSSPMLTTVRIPKEDMAHLAILTLRDRLEGRHRECLRLELPCHLMVRESSGMYIR